MLVDTSVVRNFAIADWLGALAQLSGGKIRVAEGVLGADRGEPSELDQARTFFEREALLHQAGSRAHAEALWAASQLGKLCDHRSPLVEVVRPTREEQLFAARLIDRDQRGWRRGLGLRARRLDPGEAISIAICRGRRLPFASDDEDARIAYEALTGGRALSTLSLVQRAVEIGLLDEAEAKREYEKLRERYRFYGPPW